MAASQIIVESTAADSITGQVVEQVAAETGQDPTELPPLYNVVDPDALDSLFGPMRSGGLRQGQLSFEFCGLEVVITQRSDECVITLNELQR